MFKFKDILAIIFGAGIFSFGIYFLVIPFHFYEGGATGITLITYYLFKIPVSIMNLLINIPLFVLTPLKEIFCLPVLPQGLSLVWG